MKVLCVDDEKSARDQFMRDHAIEGMSVEVCEDIHHVHEMLMKRPKKDLPDLVVMDLYRTKDPIGSDSAEEANKAVSELVEEIAAVRKRLGEVVAKAKTPAAIETLREFRDSSKLRHLPVLLRTREGLALLEDGLFREAVRLGADWMIKGRPPEVDRELMHRKVEECKQLRRRFKRDVVLMLMGAMLGAILGWGLGLLREAPVQPGRATEVSLGASTSSKGVQPLASFPRVMPSRSILS